MDPNNTPAALPPQKQVRPKKKLNPKNDDDIFGIIGEAPPPATSGDDFSAAYSNNTNDLSTSTPAPPSTPPSIQLLNAEEPLPSQQRPDQTPPPTAVQKGKFKNIAAELLKFISEWDIQSAMEILTLETRLNVNMRDADGFTPLILLIKKIASESVTSEENARLTLHALSVLINRTEIDMNLYDNDGYTAALWAVKENCLEIFRMLLKHPKTDTNFMAADTCTPLWMIIRDGNIPMLQEIIDSGRTLDMSKTNGPAINEMNSFTCAQILDHKIENIKIMVASRVKGSQEDLETYQRIKSIISSATLSSKSNQVAERQYPQGSMTMMEEEQQHQHDHEGRMFIPLDPKKTHLSDQELLNNYLQDKQNLLNMLINKEITLDEFRLLTKNSTHAIEAHGDHEDDTQHQIPLFKNQNRHSSFSSPFSSPASQSYAAAKTRLQNSQKPRKLAIFN